MSWISLRHTRRDGSHCSAVEDIAALGEHPNGWMTSSEVECCRRFRGTESEAEAFRRKLERHCSIRLAEWQAYQ
jgi:hypothetical protein